MKSKLKLPFLFLVATLITGCGTTGVVKMKSTSTAGYIPNRISTTDPRGSFGTSFFDVTKRVGISTLYEAGSYQIKYLAEEQPDAGLSIIKEFTTSLEGSKGPDLTAAIAATSKLTTNLEKMTNKSHALNLLRTSLYRLNEAAYNGFVDQKDYVILYEKIITSTEALQKVEFETIPVEPTATASTRNPKSNN